MLKDMDFVICKKIIKQLLDTGLGAVKTASKKVVHKAGETLGNKTTDPVTQLKNDEVVKADENPRNVEVIIIKRFNCSKICNKEWIKVNNLSSGQYSVNRSIRFKKFNVKIRFFGW